MDQNSLVSEAVAAGADFIREFDKSFPVRASFWAKFEDEWRWQLYIVSDSFDDSNILDRHEEAIRTANANPTPFLDPFQVKLIPTDDPLAQEAIQFHELYPGRPATRLGSGAFGGREVEGVYIYPSPIAAPAG